MDGMAHINKHETDESDLVYQLRERIRELECLLGQEWRAPRVLRLTPTENDVLGAIIAKSPIRRKALYNLVYGDNPDPPLLPIVQVYISKLRAKLRPHLIWIETIHGMGYQITPENVDRLNALYEPGERP